MGLDDYPIPLFEGFKSSPDSKMIAVTSYSVIMPKFLYYCQYDTYKWQQAHWAPTYLRLFNINCTKTDMHNKAKENTINWFLGIICLFGKKLMW